MTREQGVDQPYFIGTAKSYTAVNTTMSSTIARKSHQDLCTLWAKVHRTFFIERRRNRSGSGNISFPILDILRRSGDIRGQSRKLYKIDRNFACFGPQIFLGEGLPNFWTWVIKFRQFPIMWQSFAAIGRGTLENAWRKKKNITSIL